MTQRTPWFNAFHNPPWRNGWYEVWSERHPIDITHMFFYRSYWYTNDSRTSAPRIFDDERTYWRGLVNPQ